MLLCMVVSGCFILNKVPVFITKMSRVDIFFKIGHSRPLFSLFSSFQYSWQRFNKFCRWLDLNRSPLVLEATALPTELQPLPELTICLFDGLKQYFSISQGINIGQWCGSVGRAVASDTRGPWFKSSHRQKYIYIEHLLTVNCVLKRQK